jgi:hypothetical protein
MLRAMSVSLGDAYRRAFTRLDTRLRSLAATAPSSLDVLVPACPGWTVHSVVSHLSGIAVDALAGRISGGDPEPWLEPLTVFGLRTDDQPRCTPRP